MQHGYFALLRHDILPSGPSGPALLTGVAVIVGLGIAFAWWAVRVRQTRGRDALFGLVCTAAMVALAIAAGVGIAAESVVEVVLAVGVPAVTGLGAAAIVIHRRATALVLPGTTESLDPENMTAEVAIAGAAFVGGAIAVLVLPFVLMAIALA